MFYTNPEDSENDILFRQSIGQENNSGDYNLYKDSKQITAEDKTVTLYGNNGRYSLAIWYDDSFSYSVNVGENGMAESDFLALIS